MILTPIRDWPVVAQDIAAEARRAWILRLTRRAMERTDLRDLDARTSRPEAVFLSTEELAKRRDLLARAKAGERQAERELWEQYACRVVRPKEG